MTDKQEWFRVIPSTEGESSGIVTRTVMLDDDSIRLTFHTEAREQYEVGFEPDMADYAGEVFDSMDTVENVRRFFELLEQQSASEQTIRQQIVTGKRQAD